MPYEIVALHDEMPAGRRVPKPKVDKHAELKELLSQIPQGKTAQVPLTKRQYRAFSAGLRATGVQMDRKAQVKYKNSSAFVSWEPLTEENRPKRRGGRRKQAAGEQEVTPKQAGRPRRAAS